MSIALVVAVARNGVIGRDGTMPWRLSTDLKRFKAITLGSPVIMGRKTWDSIGRPLPGRLNIVVTRQADFAAPGATVAPSLEAAISLATQHAPLEGEIHVIGGGQIYSEALDLADRLHVTHVETDVDGDAFFPHISEDLWQAVHQENVPAGENDEFSTRYVIYRKRTNSQRQP